MATRIQRPRIRPTWHGGLRRGRERNEATLAFLSSPVMMETLRRADEQIRAFGLGPEVWEHVHQPFDYQARWVRQSSSPAA
jgi:hypothetical protein